jgi:hypothetical protein
VTLHGANAKRVEEAAAAIPLARRKADALTLDVDRLRRGEEGIGECPALPSPD